MEDNGISPLAANDSVARDIYTRNQRYVPTPPTFTSKLEEREYLKFRLAQAFRIFGNNGLTEGISGHITVRDPIKTDCFWVNPLGRHFCLMQPEDLLLVNHEGVIQDEESGPFRHLNSAAFMTHSAIHTARPDVLCAAHTHSVYGKTFSSLGVPLSILNQDACAFYNDIGYYSQYRGPILNQDEGKLIVEALGNKKAIILQNHGLLVASEFIESTVFFYQALETACRVQLMADPAAAAYGKRPIQIADEEAYLTWKLAGTAQSGWRQGLSEFELLEHKEGGHTWEMLKRERNLNFGKSNSVN